jgi:hypothetical protein
MNLELLKIIVFWNIVDTNNVTLLDANYKKGKIYTEAQLDELNAHWKKLYDEFYGFRRVKSGRYLMDKNLELAKLSLMLELLNDIENRLILLIELGYNKELGSFVRIRKHQAITDLKKLYPKIRVNAFDDCSELLETVQSIIKSQINIFDEKSGVKEKNIAKQHETIYDVVAVMSKSLGYNLNVNDMCCMEFLGHENTINSMGKKETSKK